MIELHYGWLILFTWLFLGSILTNFLWGWKYSKAHIYHIFKGILWGMLVGPLAFFYINQRKK